MLSWNVRQRLEGADWSFIKGSALLSVGMAAARALGLAFSLVLAGAFSPGDYGAIQYSITLSMIVAIVTQPFGQHVIARFVGKYNHNNEQLKVVLANAWLIMAVLFTLTLLAAIPLLYWMNQPIIGVLVIYVGLTLFYAYWGLSSGFQSPHRLTAAYLGSNIVQIVLVFLLIRVFEIRSPLLALLIYGLSYLLPLALLQYFWPFPFSLKLSLLRREVISEITRFSWPIWASHAGFMLYSSINILLLKLFLGSTAVGVYALAQTLSLVFLFAPTGIATLLMPKTAALTNRARNKLLKRMLALSTLLNGGILIAYLALIPWFVQNVFGSEYFVAMSIYITLALAQIVVGAHQLITAALVGSGRPELETISRSVAVLIIITAGWLLVPRYGPQGAAIAALLGALGALITYGVIALFMKRR